MGCLPDHLRPYRISSTLNQNINQIWNVQHSQYSKENEYTVQISRVIIKETILWLLVSFLSLSKTQSLLHAYEMKECVTIGKECETMRATSSMELDW